jgi:hypothetical protein
MTKTRVIAASAVALLLVTAPPIALAAGTVTGLGNSRTITAKVKVKSVDMATRHLTLTSAEGEDFTVKAPKSLHNLDQAKPGDTIKATYTVETEFVVSSPNTPLPKDTEAAVAARAAKGELPAGVVAHHIVVSGSVLGIDRTNHTLKLASPKGGQVHTIFVRNADRQKALDHVKVGDTITAYVTEALLLSLSRS